MVAASKERLLEITVDDMRDPEVVALLTEHRRWSAQLFPPESCHVLDSDELRRQEVTF